ncbi:hypothetical protein [Trinickia mobilis]|uniref:hypothetical protein n=1 Tax=Trinickia mobilis TaxID=2816356 RepID=UPI001A8C39B7|nr:hypothetical protein [Trinickia mobilis]
MEAGEAALRFVAGLGHCRFILQTERFAVGGRFGSPTARGVHFRLDFPIFPPQWTLALDC